MNCSKTISFVCLIAVVGLHGVAALAVEVPTARLGMIRGEVLLNGQMAKEGQAIKVGDVIKTDLGKCAVMLASSHVIHLDSDTEMKISEHLLNTANEDTTVNLAHGRLRALVRSTTAQKKNFLIRTKASTMGVRGTHVIVESPKDQSQPERFITVEGRAEVFMKSAPAAAANGAAPGEPTEKKVELLANQAIEVRGNTGGEGMVQGNVIQVSPRAVQAFADKISLPPMELKTGGDVQQIIIAPTPVFEGLPQPKIESVAGVDSGKADDTGSGGSDSAIGAKVISTISIIAR